MAWESIRYVRGVAELSRPEKNASVLRHIEDHVRQIETRSMTKKKETRGQESFTCQGSGENAGRTYWILMRLTSIFL